MSLARSIVASLGTSEPSLGIVSREGSFIIPPGLYSDESFFTAIEDIEENCLTARSAPSSPTALTHTNEGTEWREKKEEEEDEEKEEESSCIIPPGFFDPPQSLFLILMTTAPGKNSDLAMSRLPTSNSFIIPQTFFASVPPTPKSAGSMLCPVPLDPSSLVTTPSPDLTSQQQTAFLRQLFDFSSPTSHPGGQKHSADFTVEEEEVPAPITFAFPTLSLPCAVAPPVLQPIILIDDDDIAPEVEVDPGKKVKFSAALESLVTRCKAAAQRRRARRLQRTEEALTPTKEGMFSPSFRANCLPCEIAGGRGTHASLSESLGVVVSTVNSFVLLFLLRCCCVSVDEPAKVKKAKAGIFAKMGASLKKGASRLCAKVAHQD